ncbi:hypothetical protein M409DRAFT_64854 [Zasmidium cellare ATCC 36951]|uniref:Adenosine deaminase domain-containing protein n=1 Tax=Zasmidium cellare ATCC 36951 TaxID=1080233 RepID=A0A6A6CUK7_ZASCE|nr:uncharacterized protein M409DRAFT_64854 [Zasmidium cellare ATCC 36951]KAF2169868.1 hypothetical protein M409DRAFT_64854 [Zasmidium cellare ATCC 36951]
MASIALDDGTSSLETYQLDRQTLLANERKSAWDEPARQRASSLEKQAGEIIIKLREHERFRLFGNVGREELPKSDQLDMGGRFLVNKERIEQSKIFEIACLMPKGAHLHLHFNAELPPEKLFPHARRLEDTMFIRSKQPLLKPQDFAETEIQFNVLPQDTKTSNIFSKEYDFDWKSPTSASWMKWIDFREQFPTGESFSEVPMEYRADDCNGQLDHAECWAREKMIITSNKAYAEHQTTNGVWACFNQGTRAFKGLMNYASVYRWYIGDAIDNMVRDKVMYAELRPMLMDKSIPADDGVGKLGHNEQMKIVCEEAEKKKKQHGDRFPFGLKIIYCTPRSIPPAKMKSELEDCIKLKLAYPDLVCGFDLVGAEDRPNHIGHYADLLLAFTKTCERLKISIPFMFHAGETLLDTGGFMPLDSEAEAGFHNPDNSNLYDSLLLNAKRIGHGYALLKHPQLVKKYSDAKICLELCPISNELLGVCGNARQHIFPELLAAGLQCTLNADNPALYRGPGLDTYSLSHEFYQVMVGDLRMNIHGWKQLAEWSLEHACLTPQELDRAKAIFHKHWEEFCGNVVDTFGEYAKSLPDKVKGKDLKLQVLSTGSANLIPTMASDTK